MYRKHVGASNIDIESFLNRYVYIQSKRSILSQGEKSYLYLCEGNVKVCGDGYKSEGTIWILRGIPSAFYMINSYKGEETPLYADEGFIHTNWTCKHYSIFKPICKDLPSEGSLFRLHVNMAESTPTRLAVNFYYGGGYVSDHTGGLVLVDGLPGIWETFYITRM